MQGVRIISYADDTTIYACAKTEEEVYALLSEAADRILLFMHSSGLAANPDKTNFVLFGRGEDVPVLVGDSQIAPSKMEKLVGIHLTSNLSWEANLQEKEKDLRGRIGLLRRLSWHLPKKTVIKCINPIFTSKLMFGLELMADPLKHHDPNQTNCSVITRLQPLLNEAIRAALRLHRSQHISERELLRRGKQLSVASLAAERALANQAWNALGTEERRNSSCFS